MAISATLLTAKGQGGGSTNATASVTPTANRLILVAVASQRNGGATLPTVSGNGLTYVQVATIATTLERITLFRAMGSSPSAGAVTASFGGVSQGLSVVQVVEVSGINTAGTDGSAAVAQSATNSSTNTGSLTVTLGAFASTANATFGFFYKPWQETLTAGSGFTVLDASQSPTWGARLAEWKAANDTTVDMTGGGQAPVVGVAVEIAHLPQTLQPTTIASVEAVNPSPISKGAVRPQPSPIATTETVDVVSLLAKITSAPSPIVSAQAVQPVSILNQNRLTLTSAGFIGDLTNPIANILKKITSLPQPVPTSETVQAITIKLGWRVAAATIASAEAVNPIGNAILGLPHLLMVGAPSSESFGIPTYNVKQRVILVAVPGTEAVSPVVTYSFLSAHPSPITTLEAVQAVVLHASNRLVVVGIASEEAVGVPRVNVRQILAMVGGPSLGAVNPLVLRAVVGLTPDTIVSQEIVSALANVTQGPPFLHLVGIPSQEAFGNLLMQGLGTNWFAYVAGVDLGHMRLAPETSMLGPVVFKTASGLLVVNAYSAENNGVVIE